MAKRLVSTESNPEDIRFKNFGVLDDGKRSKGATVTATVINISVILFLVIASAIVKTNPELAAKITPLYVPTPKPKPPAPKPPPPPPPKPLPEVPKIKIEPPKINIPKPVELPPEIKPLPVAAPKPVQLTPPAPKAVTAVAAPKAVSFAAKAASIANNDAHPSAVRLGNPEIKSLSGPPVATPVNLGGGMHGMPPSNTGNGPAAKAVNFGSGSPSGTSVGRGAVAPVKGLSNGFGTGHGTGTAGPVVVQMGIKPTAAAPPQPVVRAATLAKPPVVTSLPRPIFTAEATAAHIQGDVSVNVVFRANGTMTVGTVVRGLGHGLDEEARKVAAGARFKPALDSNGQPTDYPTVLTVHFLSNN